MANSITTKYGTKINTAGLTPEQIARVRATAENNGAYGAKGAALANQLRKRAGVTPGAGGAGKQQAAQDPGTKGLGDTATTVDDFLEGIFKDLKPLDLSGAPKILSADDLAASRQGVYNSIYQQNTQDLQQNRQLDLEQQKQELANRGIPLNFGGEDLYSKSIADVNKRYDTMDLNARNMANVGADQSLVAQSQVNKTAQDAFLSNATEQFNSQLNAASVGGNVLQTLMQKFGISREEAQAALERKSREKIARIGAARSGGGGGTTDTGPIIGGAAPGFGV
jgi:hypothetical protein